MPQEKLHYFRVQIARATFGKPGKATKPAAAKATDAVIYVASAYAAWQRAPRELLASMWDPVAHGVEGGGLPADALARVKALVAGDASLKPLTKKVMVRGRGRAVFDGPPLTARCTPLDEQLQQ